MHQRQRDGANKNLKFQSRQDRKRNLGGFFAFKNIYSCVWFWTNITIPTRREGFALYILALHDGVFDLWNTGLGQVVSSSWSQGWDTLLVLSEANVAIWIGLVMASHLRYQRAFIQQRNRIYCFCCNRGVYVLSVWINVLCKMLCAPANLLFKWRFSSFSISVYSFTPSWQTLNDKS